MGIGLIKIIKDRKFYNLDAIDATGTGSWHLNL